jgi:hypothetical protein
MNNDYLWDGSGEPDPEIRKLETMLGGLRHSRPAPEFPAIVTAQPPAVARRLQLRWFTFAAAAVLLIAATAVIWLRLKPAVLPTEGWAVSNMEGAPRIGPQAIKGTAGTLSVGQLLETDAVSKAGLSTQEIGEIVVDPGTRLRLLANGSGARRLLLERGTIHASIWAPAGEFVVDTPSAMAVDMGCVYTLHVDASGDGQLHTTLGWVGFKLGDREAFIPAGAACATRKGRGPATPYFEDAAAPFRTALAALDAENNNQKERAAALDRVLETARTRDAFTLWHLLSRVSAAERVVVFNRLATLVAPPPGVTREGILHLDGQMLDLWWNEFGLGDISLWRHWERSWSERSANGQ